MLELCSKDEKFSMKLNKKLNRKKIDSYLLIFGSVIMVVVSFMMIMPFLIMIITSLKTPVEINQPRFSWIPKSWAVKNYVIAWSKGSWGRWFLNSLFVAGIVTFLSVFFNSLSGYAFARLEFKFKNTLFILIMISLMMPRQVTMITQFLVMKNWPLAGGNNIFGQGGTGFVNTYPGLILNGLAGAFGVFLCRQFYLNFPQALDDAAEIDGCNPFRTYFLIYIPLGKPVLASLAVLKFTFIWNDYIWPLIITNSEKLKTVQLGLSVYRDEYINWELLMAMTTIITLPLIIVFLFAQRYFIQGIMTSGVKG